MPNQETLNRYFEKLDQALIGKNYNKLLIHLRLLGRAFEHWKTPHFATELLKNSDLRKPLTRNERAVLSDEEISVHQEKLICLRRALLAWDDISLSREGSSEGENNKKLRQSIKFKGTLDKDDRHSVHIGLNALFLHLTTEKEFGSLEKEINSTFTSSDLIKFLSKQIKNKALTDEKLERDELEKIGLAIKSFQTPNKKKKLIKYAGIFLALIAALACGLSTGGAIILLFPSFSILALTLGGLIALFGFTANFGFFSQNFPNFLLSLFKKGGITEYIDNEGKRKQFSSIYKYLLTPLAIIASLTVGAGTTAITYITILHLVTKLLPLLAIIWPPLPLLIVGILAVSVGIALTVAVFTASLASLKKVAALDMGFKALCQHTYKDCLAWFKNLKNLKTHEKVGLFIMVLLTPIALAGLAYYRYTAGVDLSIFIGLTGSIVMGIVAYIAQMAFTCLSVNKLKNALIKPFSSTVTQEAVDDQNSKRSVRSIFSNIGYTLGLLVNAIGNSVLVYDGSPVSVAGAVSCGLNSFTGTMKDDTDMNLNKRKEATAENVAKIKALDQNFIVNAQKDPAASTSGSNGIKLKSPTGLPSEHSAHIAINGTSSAPTTPTEKHPSSPVDSKPGVENNGFNPNFFKPTKATSRNTSPSPQENKLSYAS